MVGNVLRDFKYAIRSFVRRPLFTAVIVLTLALGIGSNVAMFSVANAVLLRALPYDHPEELALVWTRLQATNVERSLVSGPDLKDYQTLTTRFEGFAGAAAVPGTLTGAGPAERIMNGYTTWNLFELLGVRPLHGRTFRKEDAITIDPKQFANPNPDLPPGTVMLSYGLWQRRFGGDPNVIGRTIQLDGWGSVVVGVLPPTFRIYLPADAAMPTNVDAWGVLPTNMADFARDALEGMTHGCPERALRWVGHDAQSAADSHRRTALRPNRAQTNTANIAVAPARHCQRTPGKPTYVPRPATLPAVDRARSPCVRPRSASGRHASPTRSSPGTAGGCPGSVP